MGTWTRPWITSSRTDPGGHGGARRGHLNGPSRHIVGVSKIPYAPATPPCRDSACDLHRTSATKEPADADPPAPARRRAGRGDRRGRRMGVARVLALDRLHGRDGDAARALDG